MKTTRTLISLFIIFSAVIVSAQPKFEATNSAPGEFSRMGFLPRGIAMGNAISAVQSGQLSSYYNPAVAVFQVDNSFQAAYSFLTLDRSLNFLGFTKHFDFYSSKDTAKTRTPRASAGVSLGIINSGVSDIDERDNQGFHTGNLSTSENLFFCSFANKFSKKLAIGLTVKIYYYKLYEKITSTGTGFDLGALYQITPNLRASLVLADMNAKYKWDTSPIYEQEGTNTTNSFPFAKKLGVSYNHTFADSSTLLGAAEFEFNNYGRKLIRFGAEYRIIPEITLRAGIDNIVVNNFDELIQPSGGFMVQKQLMGLTAGVEYAFVVEQYSKSLRHTAGLSILF